MEDLIPFQMKVDFPYEIYDVQRDYMNKVFESLLRSKHAVLESPTGTGKTLCLLCSTLRWFNVYKESIMQNEVANVDSHAEVVKGASSAWAMNTFPKVIYSSRTHTQLTHVMRELQKTVYKDIKKAVLGSRDQLCIHPTVSKQETIGMKNALCRMHVKEKSCQFANRVEQRKNEILAHGITDIEDLLSKSKKLSCCPYYIAKELQESADIIFLPYNYLLDPQIRKSLNIKLEGSITILDEAHNVESVCEEAASIFILSSELSSAVEDLTQEMEEMHKNMISDESFIDAERDYGPQDLCMLKEKLQKLENLFNELDPKEGNTEGVTYAGSYIFEILRKAEITLENHGEIANMALTVSDSIVLLNSTLAYSRRGASLRKFGESLLLLFSFLGPLAEYKMADSNFKMYVEHEIIKRSSSNMWLSKSDVSSSKAKKINYWCFNPGFGMSGLTDCKVRCIILTSGTLSPLDATINELGLNNPVTLENPHIIKPSQVLINIVPNGPRNLELNSSFYNRDNDEYWTELGLTLQNFSRIIPNGLLVFFPSYTTLNKAQKSWQSSGLWQKINNYKPIFVEPPNKIMLTTILNDYRKAVDTGNGKGAIILGVCRGKISEGFDFRNDYCRGVMVTGIPFPPLLDPKINLKKKYIDERNVGNKDLSGDIWYSCEAMRAVNQAIGRVIRHSNDFGAILLCDVRFGNSSNIRYLSKWLRPYVKKMKTFGESITSLTGFFKDNSQLAAQLTRVKFQNEKSCSRESSIPPVKKKPKFEGTTGLAIEQKISKTLRELRPFMGNYIPKITNNSDTQSGALQCGTSNNLEPQPGTSRSFEPQPGTSRSFDPQPGTSRGFESQSRYQTDLNFENASCLEQLNYQKHENFECSTFVNKPVSEIQYLVTKKTILDVQPAKKRKIKLIPIEFEIRSGNSDSQRSISQRIKINEIKDFICEIKRTLDAESYTTFSNLVKQYQKSHCIKTLITSLVALFPLEDDSLRSLLKGCEILVTGCHKSEFLSFCKENKL